VIWWDGEFPGSFLGKNQFDKTAGIHYLCLTFGAGIAQLVEHYLAKVAVASSSLVARSIFFARMFPRGQGGFLAAGRLTTRWD
jgi:hypothetical protein